MPAPVSRGRRWPPATDPRHCCSPVGEASSALKERLAVSCPSLQHVAQWWARVEQRWRRGWGQTRPDDKEPECGADSGTARSAPRHDVVSANQQTPCHLLFSTSLQHRQRSHSAANSPSDPDSDSIGGGPRFSRLRISPPRAHMSAVVASSSRAVLRRQPLVRQQLRRYADSTADKAKQTAEKAKESASNATSKASEGLSKVTSSASSSIGKVASGVGSTLSKIGGRTARAVDFVQCKSWKEV